MTETALDVVSLSSVKRELSIPLNVGDDDTLLEGQIAAAVEFVESYTNLPLIQKRERYVAGVGREDDPIFLQVSHIRQILRVRYWADGQEMREEPTGEIATADLGRTIFQALGGCEIWPPAGGWPARLARSPLEVDVVRQTLPIPRMARQAVILAIRQLYDGQLVIRLNSALRSLMDSVADRLTRGDEPIAVVEDQYVDLSPSDPVPPISVRLRYWGWSDDGIIDTADFQNARTTQTDEGTFPDRATAGRLWFGVPQPNGYPAELYIDGNRRSSIGAFQQQGGIVQDPNGNDYVVGFSSRDIPGRNGRTIRLEY